MKIPFRRLSPKILSYRDYRNFNNSQFMNSADSAVSRKESEILERLGRIFCNVCHEVPNRHSLVRKNTSEETKNFS